MSADRITISDWAILWQMITLLSIVTLVTCFFFIWSALLVRGNLVAWPLAMHQKRLKMIRENEYELIRRYKRELLLSHLFQTPDQEGGDDEQPAENAPFI